jgi:hypothetical protein
VLALALAGCSHEAAKPVVAVENRTNAPALGCDKLRQDYDELWHYRERERVVERDYTAMRPREIEERMRAIATEQRANGCLATMSCPARPARIAMTKDQVRDESVRGIREKLEDPQHEKECP